jgi:hypothetical protein
MRLLNRRIIERVHKKVCRFKRHRLTQGWQIDVSF